MHKNRLQGGEDPRDDVWDFDLALTDRCSMEELRTEETDPFTNFLGVELAVFDELLNRISPRTTKQNNWYRQALEPSLKVVLTLRRLRPNCWPPLDSMYMRYEEQHSID